MPKDTVVGIGEHQNPFLVETIERLLQEAKEGRLTSLTAFVVRDGEMDYELDYGELPTLELIGGIEMMKQILIMPLVSDDVEE